MKKLFMAIVTLTLSSCCRCSSDVGPKCWNRMDLVIAIDAASSQSASLFEDVKSAVKDVTAGFTIGPADTRLALLRISKGHAQLVANFDQISAIADFNATVHRVAFDSPSIGDLAEGLKLARVHALSTARGQGISRVVLLVKDRRSVGVGAVADAALLRQVASEAAAVRALGAAVQAIGIGGLWNSLELEALFGTDYLLLKNKDKALESVKSLRNLVCEANCPDKGTSAQLPGLCYDRAQHVVSASVSLGETGGQSVCRREIQRSFATCADTQKCNRIERVVGPCNADGQVSVESRWQTFDFKLQSCVTTKSVQIVNCADSLKCTGQVADVVFVLDRSSSMGVHFPSVKRATKAIIKSLTVDPSHVRVAVVTFENYPNLLLSLGQSQDLASVLRLVDDIPDRVELGKSTYTNDALEMARNQFRSSGRRNVARFVFLITDGESNDPMSTFKQTALIKNDSVTLYAIGVGNVMAHELKTMTQPESDTNLIIVDKFSQLEEWSANFSVRICVELSAPNPKLCEDSVFYQSVSQCTRGSQQVSRTEYKYDAQRKCIKSIRTQVETRCRLICVDPLDGNEYLEGAKWTNLCHEFECTAQSSRTFTLRPKVSYCLAADGQCKYVGSQPFKCRDEKGREADNCQCIRKGGMLTLLIETH